jgi:hypothetical protein
MYKTICVFPRINKGRYAEEWGCLQAILEETSTYLALTDEDMSACRGGGLPIKDWYDLLHPRLTGCFTVMQCMNKTKH